MGRYAGWLRRLRSCDFGHRLGPQPLSPLVLPPIFCYTNGFPNY